MFAHKLKFILLPQLPPLANVNWPVCFFRVLFSDHVNPQLVKRCQWRAPVCQWGPDIAPTVSTRLCRPCSGYWPFVDASRHHSYSKLYQCVILPLCYSLCHHPPHSCTPPTHPLIYSGPILMNSMKKLSKASKNQPLSACQISCTKANR